MSVLSSGLDTHKDREVRTALEPLGRLADRTGCVVLGNAHFNKSIGSDPLSLIMGSAAFANVARAALGFARDTEAEDGSCVISQVKNNLGRLDLPSLRYCIDSATVDIEEGPAEVGKLAMLGESDRSVADILSDRDRNGRNDGDDQDEVEAWLAELLADGPMAANDIYRAADANGYSKDRAKRAKKKLGIEAIHPDIKGPWFWEMPQGSTKERKGAVFPNPRSLGSLDAPLGGLDVPSAPGGESEKTPEGTRKEPADSSGDADRCPLCELRLSYPAPLAQQVGSTPRPPTPNVRRFKHDQHRPRPRRSGHTEPARRGGCIEIIQTSILVSRPARRPHRAVAAAP
jgi:hypothetical protein